MISYFKGILLSRLLVLILLFLAIRVPLILFNFPLSLAELKYMILGERLADGATLYRDVYDNTAPLAAVIYQLLDVVFGRNILVYRLLASVILFLQGMRLNSILNQNGIFSEKSFLPALLYFVFGSIFFEFDLLSPLLFGLTFLIFSINYLIVPSKEGSSNPKLFKAGFLIGLAALCYLPLMLFLLWAFLALIFFAFNAFRSSLLLLCGFLFPYAVAFTFFLYADTIPNFVQFNLVSAWSLYIKLLLPPLDLIKVLAIPLLFLSFSVFHAIINAPTLNYQLKFLQLMLWWVTVALLVTLAGQTISAISWLLFLPAAAYFGTYLFLRSGRLWITEPFFLVLLGSMVVIRYSFLLPATPFTKLNISQLLVQPDARYAAVKNAKVLVLGDNLNYYTYNQSATPYLNWQLARQDFRQLDTYYGIFKIRRNIAISAPDYIVDEVGLMPELIYKIPDLFSRYERSGKGEIYKRVR
ncbi:hypothetical protein AAE02nite_36500 [Adhaeribacter aerolatus]|uniref:Glycosyltransferase RgtA/B/C/D-like domain-containing protein n=1 Tax=Adhaeribacter aerolatus TaxID=670289 RepID=A0A512B1Z9_9BACT|nr:hypothetical protein [Adhaeribacter aerolatus]GEO05986.1 hypothetical protein AAE02nite_36500 [Adhaeribacter aerolatus]